MTPPDSMQTLASMAAWSRLRTTTESELRSLLVRFHIPELDAQGLLEQSLVESLLKSKSEQDFEIRVRLRLESACRAYWQNRHFGSPRRPEDSALAARNAADDSREIELMKRIPVPQSSRPEPAQGPTVLRFRRLLRRLAPSPPALSQAD